MGGYLYGADRTLTQGVGGGVLSCRFIFPAPIPKGFSVSFMQEIHSGLTG